MTSPLIFTSLHHDYCPFLLLSHHIPSSASLLLLLLLLLTLPLLFLLTLPLLFLLPPPPPPRSPYSFRPSEPAALTSATASSGKGSEAGKSARGQPVHAVTPSWSVFKYNHCMASHGVCTNIISAWRRMECILI